MFSAVSVGATETIEDLKQQVREAETSFAATMANRDLTAFASFIAEDAIFFDGDRPNRGKQAVIAAWAPLYEKADAPFSWKSLNVDVLADGTLAYSSGPVLDTQGRQVATFNSVWRRERDGRWRVVFDKGCSECRCAEAAKAEH
jgi:ketosteroid isomerase-like protein